MSVYLASLESRSLQREWGNARQSSNEMNISLDSLAMNMASRCTFLLACWLFIMLSSGFFLFMNSFCLFLGQGSTNDSLWSNPAHLLSFYGLWAMNVFYIYKWLLLQCYISTSESLILPTKPKILSVWPLKKTLANPYTRPFTYTHEHRGAWKLKFPSTALRISALIKGVVGWGRKKLLLPKRSNGNLQYLWFKKYRLFIGTHDGFALILGNDPNIHFDYNFIPNETMNAAGLFIFIFLTQNTFHHLVLPKWNYVQNSNWKIYIYTCQNC